MALGGTAAAQRRRGWAGREPGAATIEAKIGDKSAKKTIAMDVGEARELEIVIAGEAAAVGPEAAPGEPAAADGSASASADVKPPSGTPIKTIGMIASGAVAVVGLGVGVGFYMARQSAKDDAEALRKDNKLGTSGCAIASSSVCSDLADANDRAKSSGTISTVGFIGASAGAAAFVAFMLMPNTKTATAVHPLVDRHTVGLGAFGRF